jgi:hypothetical protein
MQVELSREEIETILSGLATDDPELAKTRKLLYGRLDNCLSIREQPLVPAFEMMG